MVEVAVRDEGKVGRYGWNGGREIFFEIFSAR